MALQPEELFEKYLEETVYKDKQVAENGVHLTLNAVYRLLESGDIDFGGGEFKEADLEKIEPTKRSADDKYGWWSLSEGIYVAEFNEKLKETVPNLTLATNERLLGCGASIDSSVPGAGTIKTLLYVPKVGINIKENARIALLLS